MPTHGWHVTLRCRERRLLTHACECVERPLTVCFPAPVTAHLLSDTRLSQMRPAHLRIGGHPTHIAHIGHNMRADERDRERVPSLAQHTSLALSVRRKLTCGRRSSCAPASHSAGTLCRSRGRQRSTSYRPVWRRPRRGPSCPIWRLGRSAGPSASRCPGGA